MIKKTIEMLKAEYGNDIPIEELVSVYKAEVTKFRSFSLFMKKICEAYKSSKDITFDSIVRLSRLKKYENGPHEFGVAAFDFLFWVIESGLYGDDDETDILENWSNIYGFAECRKKRALKNPSDEMLSGNIRGFGQEHEKRECFHPEENVYTPYSFIDMRPYKEQVISKTNNLSHVKEVPNYILIPNATKNTQAFIIGIFNSLNLAGFSRMFFGLSSAISFLYQDNDNRFCSYTDFSDESFEEHWQRVSAVSIKGYKKNSLLQDLRSGLITFYECIQRNMEREKYKQLFKIYTSEVINHFGLLKSLEDGFHIVHYNPYEIPHWSKMLLVQEQGKGKDGIVVVDYSELHDSKFLLPLLEFLWKGGVNKGYKKRINSVYKWLAALEESSEEINDRTVMAEVSRIKSLNASESETARALNSLSGFLKSWEKNKHGKISKACFDSMKGSDRDRNKKAIECYTEDETVQLEEMYRKYDDYAPYKCTVEDRKRHSIMAKTFSIYARCPLRLKELFRLNIGDIRCSSESTETGWYIWTDTKMSQGKAKRTPISNKVKKLFDEVLELNKDIRENANEDIKNKIFIYPSDMHFATIKVLNPDKVYKHHEKVCRVFGFRYLPIKAIRKTYNTSVMNTAKDMGLTENEVRKITGHSVETIRRHYEVPDLFDFYEAVYGVPVGDTPVYGECRVETELEESHRVLDGCGHCSAEKCILTTIGDCWICPSLISVPDDIPNLEKAISLLDQFIYEETNVFEKQKLIERKIIIVARVKKLRELVEQEERKNA